MEIGRTCDDSQMNDLFLKNERIAVLDSIWVPCSSPIFPGSTSMVNFEDIRSGDSNSEMAPFFGHIDDKLENSNEDSLEEYFHSHPEKKRRLLPEQVRCLEKSFEVDNKLEPDRKRQLAKELSLQPRQVAIWFQNRRARYKTKHIEKEYDILKACFDKLKEEYDALYRENRGLRDEVHKLTEKLHIKPKFEVCDPICPMDLEPNKSTICTQNAASTSVKSDIIDPDSPRYVDGILLEPDDSSHVFEQEQSDFSQDEDDSLSKGFLSSTCFPKLELENLDELQPNSCNLGFPIQDQGTWSWTF